MSTTDHTTSLGIDLAALVRTLGSDVTGVEPVTTLPSMSTPRASFVITLADGRVVKGRRCVDAERARTVAELAPRLGAAVVPRVLAVRGVALIEEWVDGRPLTRADATPDLLSNAGAALRAIHDVSLPPRDAARADEARAHWRARVARNVAALEGALAPRVLDRARARAAAFDPAQGTPGGSGTGIIHGDFCAENIVRRPDGGIRVVDSETLSLDVHAYDLARTRWRWPMDGAARAAFLRGYAGGAPIEEPPEAHDDWLLAVLTEAAVFRLANDTPDARAPIERLERLLLDPAEGA